MAGCNCEHKSELNCYWQAQVGRLMAFSMSGLSRFPSGGPVPEPGAPHPGACPSEAPRGGEQRDSEDRWQVSGTFKYFNTCVLNHGGSAG